VIQVTASIAGDQPDPYPWNNTYSTFIEAFEPRYADLAVQVKASADVITVRKKLTYTVTATNRGPDQASGVVVEEWLPPGVQLVSYSSDHGSCFAAWDQLILCEIGVLPAGAQARITIVVIPGEGGTIQNLAYVYNWAGSRELDQNFDNNQAVVTTTVRGPNPPVVTNASHTTWNVGFGFFVPCAEDFVYLQGELRVTSQSVYNRNSGSGRNATMFNGRGISGFSFRTGEAFVANGYSRSQQRYQSGFPATSSDTSNIMLKSASGDTRYVLHTNYHLTFGPNGEPRVSVDKSSVTCR
jgi:uncharacterized repeat protein (TIGR01451 family)